MELDEALVKITEQNDLIGSLNAQLRVKTDELKQKDVEAQRLRENNMKLFLKVSAGEPHEDDPKKLEEPQGKQSFDDFVNDWDI